MRSTLLLALVLPFVSSSCFILRAQPRPPVSYTTESGLEITELTVPTAGAVALPGDLVTIEYSMQLDDGSVIDSTNERGTPVTFELGAEQVPPGLDEGITGMIELARRLLVIPPSLAYGTEGIADRVPPNSRLTVEVELVELESANPLPAADENELPTP